MFTIILFFKVLNRKIRDKILWKVFHKSLPRPWMTHEEIIIIEGVLKKLKPKRCLEWGGGYSTLIFPQFAGQNTKWVSVEHNKDWAEKIKRINKNPNVTISHVPQNNPSVGSLGEDETVINFEDYKDYLEFPSQFASFDFILIDGRARKYCLVEALDFSKKNSIVVLHDAERKQYHQALEHYKYSFSFSDYTQGLIKLWIGSNSINVRKRFNVNKYMKLFQLYLFSVWLRKLFK